MAGNELDRLAMGARDHRTGMGVIDVETILAHELARVVLIAQGERVQINRRYAGGDRIEIGPVERELALAFQ